MTLPLLPTDHQALQCRLPDAPDHANGRRFRRTGGALYPTKFLAQTAVPLAALAGGPKMPLSTNSSWQRRSLGMPLIAAPPSRAPMVDANREAL